MRYPDPTNDTFSVPSVNGQSDILYPSQTQRNMTQEDVENYQQKMMAANLLSLDRGDQVG